MLDRSFALAFALSVFTAPASAQFVGVSDQRSAVVSASLGIDDAGDGEVFLFDSDIASPDAAFGLFDAGLEARVEHAPGVWARGSASQISVFTAGRLEMSGRVEAEVSLGDAVVTQPADTDASSLYKVRFTVEELSFIRICLRVDSESPAGGSGTDAPAVVRVREVIDGAGEPFFGYAAADLNEPGAPYSFNLHLAPGEWEVAVSATASAEASAGNPGRAEASYEGFVEYLGKPCNGADVAEPVGVIDLADITEWVGAYTTGQYIYNPTYDTCRDQLFNLCDITMFVGLLQEGCGD